MPPSSRCLSFLNGSIAPYSSPRRLPSRGPQYLKAYGCLIKDFRHDKKEGSFLNVSIAPYSSPRQFLSRGPQYLKPKKKQKHGFPTKTFGNDRKRRSSPLNGSIRNPNYLRAKASGFPPPRHPANLQAGVHKYLKTKEKAKAWIPA